MLINACSCSVFMTSSGSDYNYLDKPYSYTGVHNFKARYFCYSETSKDAFFKTCWLLFLVCKGNILFNLLSKKIRKKLYFVH